MVKIKFDAIIDANIDHRNYVLRVTNLQISPRKFIHAQSNWTDYVSFFPLHFFKKFFFSPKIYIFSKHPNLNFLPFWSCKYWETVEKFEGPLFWCALPRLVVVGRTSTCVFSTVICGPHNRKTPPCLFHKLRHINNAVTTLSRGTGSAS